MGRPRIYANDSERTAAWKKRNPERAAAHNRQSVRNWKVANPEKVAAANRESVRRWKQKHPERYRVSSLLAYGLTVEQYSDLALAQGGVCAICRRDSKLVVDHDHATGAVRGLLCRNCNLALGLLGDDAESIRRAVAYL